MIRVGKTIRKYLNSSNKKILIENFLSLSTLQFFNYLLPLITLPYLVRILGAEKYGIIVYAQSVVSLFNIITDFGFNLTGVKAVSENQNNKPKLEFIFTNVYTIKFILLGICSLILLLLILLVPKFKADCLVFVFSFGITIGYTLFPSWFFHGMEKMKYITIFNIASKFIFTILIFIIVKNPEDYYMVPFINSLGFLLSGFVGFNLVLRKYKISIRLKRIFLSKHMKEGIFVFISIGSSSLLYLSPNIILGSILGYNYSAYYSGAEKILSAFKNVVTIINQVLFPRFAAIKSDNKTSYLKVWMKLFKVLILISFVISLLVFLLSKTFVTFILTAEFLVSISTLRILSITIILQATILFFGQQGLLIIGKVKELAITQLIPSILFLLVAPLLLKLNENYSIFLVIFVVCQLLIVLFRVLLSKTIQFF
jgi:PST family polysaccharide transporter